MSGKVVVDADMIVYVSGLEKLAVNLWKTDMAGAWWYFDRDTTHFARVFLYRDT